MKAVFLGFFFVLGAACSGTSHGFLSPTFPDNDPDAVREVMNDLSQRQPSNAAFAVGVTTAPAHLFAYNLQSGSLAWKTRADVKSAPRIAGQWVVTHETGQDGGEIVVRSLADGQVRYRVEDGALHLMGAGGDDEWVAISLSTGGGVGAISKLITLHNGSHSWDYALDLAIGSPAVARGRIFLPWGNQNLSVLDARSHDELARFRLLDDVVAEAAVSGNSLILGHTSAIRLDENAARGRIAETSHLSLPEIELPGRPTLMHDAYRPPEPAASATHRIQLAWKLAAGSAPGTFALENDELGLIFYKAVFALEPATGRVRWVHEHSADVVGATVTEAGMLVADAEGRFVALGAGDGRPIWISQAPVRPTVVVFDAETFRPSGSPEAPRLSLRDQLLAIAQSTDSRLVPARMFAVAALGQLPEPEVTGNLVALCDQPNAPRAVQSAACQALGTRTVGGEYIVAALRKHSSFLDNTHAPPVGALAKAAVSTQTQEAVPLLLAHLRDPETSPSDLSGIALALGEFGDRSAAEPLAHFLLLYHADTEEAEMLRALGLAMDTLVRLQGPVATDTLVAIANDFLTPDPLRARANLALQGLGSEAVAARERDEARQRGEEEAAQNAAEAATSSTQEELPTHLSTAIVERTLDPVHAELRECVRRSPAHPPSVRLLIGVAGDGQVDMVSVSPASLESCIAPIIRARTFPANRHAERQQVTYILRN